MRRRILLALGTAVVSLAIVALAGELVARVAGSQPYTTFHFQHPWSAPHPALGWINLAGVARSHEPGNAPMTFWPGGRRRSRPGAAADRAGREAVLVGGSWTQGFGVVDEETFAWRAGTELPGWRIENLGTGGYGTLQALMSAELAWQEGRIHPELLVYGFATFHAERNVLSYRWLRVLRDSSGQRFAAPRAALEGDGIVRHAPGGALPDWPLERRSALVATLHDAWYLRLLRERDAWALPVTLQLIAEFDAFGGRIGARPVVMILFGNEELAPYLEFLEARHIEWVDCRYPENVMKSHLRLGGIGHPTPLVHEHWGRCLADLIRGHETRASATGAR